MGPNPGAIMCPLSPRAYARVNVIKEIAMLKGFKDFILRGNVIDLAVAVVIGAGNVAMDVARMLALNPAELDPTDTALYALKDLHSSKVRTVHICGRRGPEHAAFTAPELRDLVKLEHTDVYMDHHEIQAAMKRVEEKGETPREVRSNLDAMLAISEHEKKHHERSMRFHFLSTPIEIKGKDRVEEVIFGINRIEGNNVIATGETYSIKCGLVISGIGYESTPIDGISFEKGRVDRKSTRLNSSH